MKRKWTDKDLIKNFNESGTMCELLTKLNLRLAGGTYSLIKKHLKRLGLNFQDNSAARQISGLKKYRFSQTYTDKELFIDNGPASHASVRSRYLQKRKDSYICDICGITEWHGSPISLQVDHINGVHKDNRIENLRLLCPNCHAQTETFCIGPKSE